MGLQGERGMSVGRAKTGQLGSFRAKGIPTWLTAMTGHDPARIRASGLLWLHVESIPSMHSSRSIQHT